jgi:hypothetical protein
MPANTMEFRFILITLSLCASLARIGSAPCDRSRQCNLSRKRGDPGDRPDLPPSMLLPESVIS